MRVTALLGLVVGAIILLLLEATIWTSPYRHFTLAGHFLAQAGVVAIVGVAVLIRASFEADGSVPTARVRLNSRAYRRAQRAAELAELKAREARALAEREAALLGRDHTA